jgi:VIT1/CCC1 family predicted Fe2+/Mn2+ transporter
MPHDKSALSHLHHRAERHGSWTSGRARAAVFGLSDGLVSNLSLVAGVAGATSVRSTVIVGGIAGLVAGATSMAIGEYVSVKANSELLERELETERAELAMDPEGETLELAGIYVERGIDYESALAIATQMMANPTTALEAHARDELGIDPCELGSPIGAASWSFGAFSIGAAIPLAPWFVGGGFAALVVSLVLGLICSAALGGGLARLAGRTVLRGATRQVVLVLLAFAATSLIGRLVGVAV